MDFLPESLEYIESTDLAKRKKLGQYFTSQTIVTQLLKLTGLSDSPDLDILEPSCGTGEAIEFDHDLAEISRDSFPGTIVCEDDTLRHEFTRKYDLVVGNPPYFEFKPEADILREYAEVIGGRINIFSLFVKRCVDILKPGGYLAFVIPPSMNNGAYFAKLREYIVGRCSIEHLLVLNADHFQDANQTVMLLVLRREPNNGDYVFRKDGLVLFTTERDYLTRSFRSGKTLLEMGFTVSTGTVVWNQHKEKLTTDSTATPLLWANNIGDGVIELNNKAGRIQHIAGIPAKTGPALLVNRIIGQPGRGALRAALVPAGMKYLAENHVNVITGEGKNEADFVELLAKLRGKKDLPKLLQALSGNTQLSKTELERYLPL
jgi:adenine-specific DNA-methyltransferase